MPHVIAVDGVTCLAPNITVVFIGKLGSSDKQTVPVEPVVLDKNDTAGTTMQAVIMHAAYNRFVITEEEALDDAPKSLGLQKAITTLSCRLRCCERSQLRCASRSR